MNRRKLWYESQIQTARQQFLLHEAYMQGVEKRKEKLRRQRRKIFLKGCLVPLGIWAVLAVILQKLR